MTDERYTTAEILDAFAWLDEQERALADVHKLDEHLQDFARSELEANIDAWLGVLSPALEGKLDALAHVIDRAGAEVSLAKVHENRAAARRRAALKVQERCKALALALLRGAQAQGLAQTAKSGLPFVETGRVKVSIARTPAALVAPESTDDWPDEWLVAQAPKPNRIKAKKALKAGAEVRGFSLQSGERLAIR